MPVRALTALDIPAHAPLLILSRRKSKLLLYKKRVPVYSTVSPKFIATVQCREVPYMSAKVRLSHNFSISVRRLVLLLAYRGIRQGGRSGGAGFLLILLLAGVLAQFPPVHGQAPDAWQPVPTQDLQLKDNPADPGAAAMILEREVYTDDEKQVQTEWVRIKVLTEEGRKYADVEIPYAPKTQSIEKIRGRTVRADGTVIEFQGTVFDRVVARYKGARYEAKAFALPGVEVGSVIDYSYTTRWKDSPLDVARHPGNYAVQDGWAVPTAAWTIQQDLFTRHARFTLRPIKGANLHYAKVRLPELVPSTEPDGAVRVEVSSVPAIGVEDYMPPESMMNSRIHFYYAIGTPDNFWAAYGKFRARAAESMLEKTKALEQEAARIAPPGEPPTTRLRKLYARVQQIRDTSFEPSMTAAEMKREHLEENKSAEDILRHGYAYGNEVNYLFTALARAAGFDAKIVEVSDRRHGQFEANVFDSSQLDAMVVAVRMDGADLFLDPASRFCPYGLVPWYEANTTGVRWDALGGAVVSVPPLSSETAIIQRTADLKLLQDGTLEGTLEIDFRGQEALDRRLEALNTDEAERRNLVEEEVKSWLPPGTRVDLDAVTGWDGSEEPLRATCHLHVPQFAALTSRRMLFPLAVFRVNSGQLLHHQRRSLPVYFRFAYRQLDTLAVALPVGYSLEAIPDGHSTKTPFASFDSKVTSQSGAIHLDRAMEMNGYYFRSDSYAQLRQYLQEVVQHDAQNVVLDLEARRAR